MTAVPPPTPVSVPSADCDTRRSPRTLLVGTAMSVAQLRHHLQLASPRPRVVGCLMPANTHANDNTPTPLLGGFNDLPAVVEDERVELVLVSLPLVMREAVRRVTEALGRLGVTWRFMPTLADQLAGRTNHVGPAGHATAAAAGAGGGAGAGIDPAQIIDRQPRPLDTSAIRDCLAGKTVLITGAGGSIGSELARIVCRFQPGRIVLMERSENALFEIDRELAHVFPDLPRKAVLHDVTHRRSTFDQIGRLSPDVIFHAAAHKHVPMMEDHPSAAVENNFYGTRAIADAADAHGVERFVMISTDKAVNPSSVMGASKRLAELYIQHLNQRSGTVFSMVRFGNVIGSACSVLPIWTDQLARGGPITVTHPDMTRYFMTIPEAAGLVLQAGALSGSVGCRASASSHAAGAAEVGGEVFLLDMGEPIAIVDLARRFIRAHGYEPNVDIEIAFTGVRPGEKLFEELAYDGEDMLPTPHDAIRIWRTTPPDDARLAQTIATFDRLRTGQGDPSHLWQNASRDAILTALRSAIPEMVAAAAG